MIMGFIFGLIMLGILKNEYHFYQLKKGKNFLTALVLSTIFGGAIWWLLLILFFVLRNTGALDKMKGPAGIYGKLCPADFFTAAPGKYCSQLFKSSAKNL